MKVLIKLGQNIKDYRKAQGYTQTVFADKLGIHVCTLSKIELGKQFVTLKNLMKIVQILKINIKELFDFEEMNCQFLYAGRRKDLIYYIENLNEAEIKFFLECIKSYIKYNL